MKKIILVTILLLSPLALFAGDFNDKIIGGTKASFGKWPSTVALLYVDKIKKIETGNAVDKNGERIPVTDANNEAKFCGASLIAPNWVLTAAHCVVKNKTVKSIDKVTTLIGAFDLKTDGYRREIKKIIVHPDYKETTDENDVALLQLKIPVNADAITIASTDAPSGTLAIAVGWGALDGTSTNYPSKLYEVELPVVDRSICRSFFGAARLFNDTMLCAGYIQGEKRDVCNGDSGGPLMARINGSSGYQQIGITSWGASCSESGSYGAYTRLSKYRSWINSKVSPSTSGESGGGSMLYLILPFFLLLTIRRYQLNFVLSNIKKVL